MINTFVQRGKIYEELNEPTQDNDSNTLRKIMKLELDQ